MGGSESKLKGLKIDRDRWSKMESKGEYDVMWDKSGEEAQLYRFVFDETMDIDNEIDTNKFRANPDGNHVLVLGAENTKESVGLCGSQKNVEVLTERIPTLLCDSRQLSFQESNVVLYNALKGYSRLSDKFGPTEVTDNMIGFNSQGQTKVWVNTNFGLNHPLNEQQSDDLTNIRNADSQERMVHSIINLVERKCERGSFPDLFKTDVYRNTSFNDATQFLQRAQVAPPQALEENKVVLNKVIEQMVQHQPVRQTLPAPVSAPQQSFLPPASHTSISKPVNSRVSFNYVSPAMK